MWESQIKGVVRGWIAFEKRAAWRRSPSGLYRPCGRKKAEARLSWTALLCLVRECLAYVCKGDGKAPVFQKLKTW